MRMLMFHVDQFSSTVTERGRSKVVEDYNPNAKTIEVGESLLILASVEKEDEPIARIKMHNIFSFSAFL